MEVTLKPFRESHLDILQVPDEYKAESRACAKHLTQLGTLRQFGTFILDGRILLIAGYFEPVEGVLEVFMIPSIYVPQYKFTTIRTVRWWLDYMTKEHKARRIQTWGDKGEERAKWLHTLGFEIEGVLNSYMPDGKPITIWGRKSCHR